MVDNPLLPKACSLRSDGGDFEPNLDLEQRRGLRRVIGLSTELRDVSEVEYRQLRLEQVVLVGIYPPKGLATAEESLRELAALCQTAGARILDGLMQARLKPDPGVYLGRGKARELKEIISNSGADTVVVDGELAPSQRRALEDIVQVKVIDRTAVILDIFSQHAKSKEGKAQVELAQLEYLLPRLRGWGESMSRQAGGQVGGLGMGSRGPGETKIELDRRRIRMRMSRLRSQLGRMRVARRAKDRRRVSKGVPSVVIVGYTNAGKSSLMNCLTEANLMVENALFATLDPTVRRCETPSKRQFTLCDTVGFVRNLPHQLVEAFRSTLEQARAADVLLHVVDASHPEPLEQIGVVNEVLAESQSVKELVVLNKCDQIDEQTRIILRSSLPEAVLVSTRSREGIAELLERLERLLPGEESVWLSIPFAQSHWLEVVYVQAQVLERQDCEFGVRLQVRACPELLARLKDLVESVD